MNTPVSKSTTAFSKLHSIIQEELYRMNWQELRHIQVEAIHALMDSSEHVIISAMTAGGKTEAAFLPILSKIAEDYLGSVKAIYVGPLKALINDQFRRLEDLCERAQIPVHKWHGDASQAGKNRLLKTPSGILLITPESIEALFVNRSSQLSTLFSNLSFVVIDEMHSFIGNERGAHLKSLLSRLTKKSKNQVRFIGLSATLGQDEESPKRWLSQNSPESVQIIKGSGGDKRIQYLIKAYVRSKDGIELNKVENEEVFTSSDDHRLARDILESFYGKTALIFGNKKSELENYADLINRLLKDQNKTNSFRIHHGSLSKAEREFTEEELKSSRPTVTFCSSTLEMGINVGNVSKIGQIGAPWSVNSLTQRLGRSGRKDGEPSIMEMYIVEYDPILKEDLESRLFPSLLRSIAMTELMLEKWNEPAEADCLHLSTCIQQVLSLITETGGCHASMLYNTLVKEGTFQNIDEKMFMDILRSLGNNDLIEQSPEGLLIIGLKGERVVRSFDFYSAFTTSENLKVMHRAQCIGNISDLPMDCTHPEKFLILGGKRWRVLDVDEDRKEVIVEPSRGGKLPIFGSSNEGDIHPAITIKMRELLENQKMPMYLDPKAKEMLTSARNDAKKAHLLESSFYQNCKELIWFPWTGSKIHRTLWRLARFGGLSVEMQDECGLTLTFKNSKEDVLSTYRQFLEKRPTINDLTSVVPFKVTQKYDNYLSESLQKKLFGTNKLDIDGALCLIRQI